MLKNWSLTNRFIPKKNQSAKIAVFGLVIFTAIGSGAVHAIAAGASQFVPTQKNLIGASTQRHLVDLEIIATANGTPDSPQSGGLVRLRLERAFIANFLINDSRSDSLLSLIVDQPTALPNVLLEDASRRKQYRQGEPEIPVIAHEELVRRQIMLDLSSNELDGSFARYYAGGKKCSTIPGNPALREIEQEKSVGTSPCAHSSYPDGRKWLAYGVDGSPVIIECHGFDRPTTTHCSTRFVFQKFSVRLGFHESKLHQWFDVVEFGRKFLSSKQIMP